MSVRFLRRLKSLPMKRLFLQTRLMSDKDKDGWSSASSSSDEEGDIRKTEQNNEEKCEVKVSKGPFVPSSDVPGLSSDVYQICESRLFPGVSKEGTYKNPEYFSYHCTSFYNAEIELTPYRLPQPSAIDPSKLPLKFSKMQNPEDCCSDKSREKKEKGCD
uniref:Uncharacterized protein n=1 Tax=Graphocephala atropunctata TaxID=36148 RepID=A0A1B6KQX2_9HEMI